LENIDAEYIKRFVDKNDIAYMATQSKLCIPIINRLCQKMAYGIRFNDIKVCDNMVIDGHHRYISSLIVGFDIGKVSSNKTCGTKGVEWPDIDFVEEDWDTSSKIQYLNELDAIYNNLDVEILHQITSPPEK
jgi:hypothetical protein